MKILIFCDGGFGIGKFDPVAQGLEQLHGILQKIAEKQATASRTCKVFSGLYAGAIGKLIVFIAFRSCLGKNRWFFVIFTLFAGRRKPWKSHC